MTRHDPVLALNATVNDLELIRQFLDKHAANALMSEDAAYDLLLAVTELVTNSMVHGYNGLPGYIELTFSEQNGNVVVLVRDHAPLFDPTQMPDPDLAAPLENRRLGGLGIYLARTMVDGMTYRALPEGGNEITLVIKKDGRRRRE